MSAPVNSLVCVACNTVHDGPTCSGKYLVTVHAEPPHEPVTYTFVAPSEAEARAMAREACKREHRAWRSMTSRRIN